MDTPMWESQRGYFKYGSERLDIWPVGDGWQAFISDPKGGRLTDVLTHDKAAALVAPWVKYRASWHPWVQPPSSQPSLPYMQELMLRVFHHINQPGAECGVELDAPLRLIYTWEKADGGWIGKAYTAAGAEALLR